MGEEVDAVHVTVHNFCYCCSICLILRTPPPSPPLRRLVASRGCHHRPVWE